MLVLAVLSAAISVGATGSLRAALYRGGPGGLRVSNYKGVSVPALGGVVMVSSYVLYSSLLALLAATGVGGPASSDAFSPAAIGLTFFSRDHFGFGLVVLGFFMLGAIDDLAGAGQAKGLRGHARALLKGQITGGGIKAIGGLAIGLVAGVIWEGQIEGAALDALVVALAANIINLFDLRPGRAIKVFLLMWLPLAVMGWKAPFLPLSSVVSASAVTWLPTDLKEKGMLGDAGANLIGGVAGAGVALVLETPEKVIVAALLVGLTLLSERTSFTSIIERWSVLKKLDQLGRVRE